MSTNVINIADTHNIFELIEKIFESLNLNGIAQCYSSDKLDYDRMSEVIEIANDVYAEDNSAKFFVHQLFITKNTRTITGVLWTISLENIFDKNI